MEELSINVTWDLADKDFTKKMLNISSAKI